LTKGKKIGQAQSPALKKEMKPQPAQTGGGTSSEERPAKNDTAETGSGTGRGSRKVLEFLT